MKNKIFNYDTKLKFETERELRERFNAVCAEHQLSATRVFNNFMHAVIKGYINPANIKF